MASRHTPRSSRAPWGAWGSLALLALVSSGPAATARAQPARAAIDRVAAIERALQDPEGPRQCLRSRRSIMPEVRGEVVIGVDVDGRGRVRRTRPERNTSLDLGLAYCLRRWIRGRHLPPRAGQTRAGPRSSWVHVQAVYRFRPASRLPKGRIHFGPRSATYNREWSLGWVRFDDSLRRALAPRLRSVRRTYRRHLRSQPFAHGEIWVRLYRQGTQPTIEITGNQLGFDDVASGLLSALRDVFTQRPAPNIPVHYRFEFTPGPRR